MAAQGDEDSVKKPLNREPSLSELLESFLTPLSIAYDRNHGPIPELPESSHTLEVVGEVPQPLRLGVAALKLMPQHEVVCTLQCAGNRRHTMRTSLKEVDGIDWGDGAVMNCRWRGPRLRDVLLRAGVEGEAAASGGRQRHVAFGTRAQRTQEDDFYGASIPLSRALDPAAEAILALEMNGAPLPAKHGAPVRAIVPGVAGARCVKWLQEISVQEEESACHYQRRDYKILPPHVENAEQADAHWHDLDALQDMPLNSVIGLPESGSRVSRDGQGTVRVVGYALPSAEGGPVEEVQVSTDEGRTWQDAGLHWGRGTEGERGRWCWCLWTVQAKIELGEDKKIWSRAKDRLGIWQERSSQWNLRGMAYNGYGEVTGLEIFD